VDAKGKVSYQDFPCGQAPAIGTPDAARTGAGSPAPADSAASPVMRQLDAAVKAAIAGRDLPRAKGLAVTAQHWEWIAEAEKEQQAQPVTGRTQADLRAEKGASQECRDARRNYELESRSPEAIEKMKHLMYEACGMEAPADTRRRHRPDRDRQPAASLHTQPPDQIRQARRQAAEVAGASGRCAGAGVDEAYGQIGGWGLGCLRPEAAASYLEKRAFNVKERAHLVGQRATGNRHGKKVGAGGTAENVLWPCAFLYPACWSVQILACYPRLKRYRKSQ
jgi:hypothetical protein